jgi:2'-5' RNA ligase
MSLAIFILPKEPLNTELVHWKERIKKELPDQPYTAHPPHMTLINIEVMNEKKCLDTVSTFAGSVDSFQISVNIRDIFWGDIATGGHTLFFGVKQNNALFTLQKSLANALLPVRKRTPAPKYLTASKPLIESFEKYGFPFVGEHWIPHFSVSSLRTEKTHPIITDFLLDTKKYDVLVNQFSLWRVDGDKHIQLETISFQ